jgi:beta-N-acetylhexosaminidase
MSERERFRRDIGQLLWFGFEGEPGDMRDHIRAGRCGGVVLFSRNLIEREPSDGGAPELDVEAFEEMVRRLREAVAANEAPLLVAVDQEGGRVQRLRRPGTRWPAMLSLDRAGDRGPALAAAVGKALGDELAALDIDVNFAPVLDVHTNPDNPIIGDRAFSSQPERAAELALAFAGGLAEAGIIGCGKHFPGHGDTATDSHLELPRLEADRERLESVELVPFARAAASLPMIMTAHVIFAAIDPTVPATLSPRAIDGVLRRELGYRGVVVSDDLDMKAIADHFGAGEAAERSILAGCDVLLLCRDPDHQIEVYERLIRAGEARSELRERIRAAAGRVEKLKRSHFRAARTRPDRAVLGCPEHLALAAKLAGDVA